LLPINTLIRIGGFAIFLLLQSLLLSSCTNSFHLREAVSLPKTYQKIQLENISAESDFSQIFENTLEEAGGQLIEGNSHQRASAKIIIQNLREGKRVVAYTKERKARIYLVFLKLDYTIQNLKNGQKTKKQRLSLDKTFIYDANFALGKAEEEKQIRKSLHAEAARLILFNLKHRSNRK